MAIAQDIFEIAMNLMDEESEDGTFAGYPDEYKKKAWSLLTMLQAELLPPAVSPLAVTSEASLLQVDDRSSLTILPYGLAAHLLMSEDQNRAAYFNARYDELKRKRPAVITKIIDVYTPDESTPVESPDGEWTYPTGTVDGGEW